MANNMTVEELIELLQREYPQALIFIERGTLRYRSSRSSSRCSMLAPHVVRATPKNGRVYIICDQHDC